MESNGSANDTHSLRGRVFHSIRENILLGIYKSGEELPWRLQPDISGGGYFYDLAPHQLDLLHQKWRS